MPLYWGLTINHNGCPTGPTNSFNIIKFWGQKPNYIWIFLKGGGTKSNFKKIGTALKHDSSIMFF